MRTGGESEAQRKRKGSAKEVQRKDRGQMSVYAPNWPPIFWLPQRSVTMPAPASSAETPWPDRPRSRARLFQTGSPERKRCHAGHAQRSIEGWKGSRRMEPGKESCAGAVQHRFELNRLQPRQLKQLSVWALPEIPKNLAPLRRAYDSVENHRYPRAAGPCLAWAEQFGLRIPAADMLPSVLATFGNLGKPFPDPPITFGGLLILLHDWLSAESGRCHSHASQANRCA